MTHIPPMKILDWIHPLHPPSLTPMSYIGLGPSLLHISHALIEELWTVSIENTGGVAAFDDLTVASRILLPEVGVVFIFCWSHYLQVVRADRLDVKWYFLPALVFVTRLIRADNDKAFNVDNRKRHLLIHAHHAPVPVTLSTVNLAAEFKILVLLWLRMRFNDNTLPVSEQTWNRHPVTWWNA